MKWTHLDLFSGIGGFAIAAQAAGFKTIGFSEVDPYACALLKQHWPDVPNFGDIRNVRNIRADLVTGGFPCQPYSFAGKRGGASDDRALWPEMFRVIAEVKPTYVLAENVPGIINMELDRVLSDLESLGYSTWPLVIPACAIGAQHIRQRVYILAHALRGRKPLGRLLERARGLDELDAQRSNGIGASESPVLGADSRIPARLHRPRCRALGNAIVPQVAEILLRWMMEISTNEPQ